MISLCVTLLNNIDNFDISIFNVKQFRDKM